MLFVYETHAQTRIVFNKTEHDFGLLSASEVPFEQDFLFRNTGHDPIVILSVRSVHSALSFIHTRSEVLQGEYGFVKVKLKTDSLSGLFHDEVYITMKQGAEVTSEVLYLRAQISTDGASGQERAFRDSPIATSVEVSPDDIETMEGFMGKDRLTQAEAEITYLRKQVSLKGDLIERLSSDLHEKQLSEAENIRRLEELENTLRNGQNSDLALKQVSQLTGRLVLMQKSDSALRAEIHLQEASYLRLKQEADSARQYARQLSIALQERFRAEAEVIEKASALEHSLKQRQIMEHRQQVRIDSLKQLLAGSHVSDTNILREIETLKAELAWKRKEQELQTAHARHQHEKIERLKQEKEKFQSITDSLSQFLSNRDDENRQLQQRLEQSTLRINNYEQLIDSLEHQAALTQNSSTEATLTLDSIRQALSTLEQEDLRLKQTIANKDRELHSLQAEKQQSEKDIRALESATAKQLEEAHNLMYRINQLSTRESQSRLELNTLKQALRESQAREDSIRMSVATLVSEAAEKESSLQSVSSELANKEEELNALRATQETLRDELSRSQHVMSHNNRQIDSLNTMLAAAENRRSLLEHDVNTLQQQIILSQRKEKTYLSRASELESQLAHAHLSNELAFEELKADIDYMRHERDDYKLRYQAAQKEIEALNEALAESRQNEESALAFAREIKAGAKPRAKSEKAAEIIFRVNVLTSDKPAAGNQQFKGFSPVFAYAENGKYRYAIGAEPTLEKALELKEQLRDSGFPLTFVVAFRDGTRISLKEALETAQR